MREKHKKSAGLSTREQQMIEKMRQHPEIMERVEAILNTAHSSGKTADEIEEMLISEIRQLGHATMQSWAMRTEQKLSEEFKQKDSSAVVAKKKR